MISFGDATPIALTLQRYQEIIGTTVYTSARIIESTVKLYTLHHAFGYRFLVEGNLRFLQFRY